MPKDNFSDVEVLLEKNQSFTNTNSVKKIHALYGDLYPPEILAIFPLPLLEQITFDSAKVNAFDIQLFNLIKLQKSTAEINMQNI